MTQEILNRAQASRLRKLVRHYKPKMGKSWKRRSADELWLRVLSQIVVAGNAAPAEALTRSQAVKEKLAYSRLKKLSPRRRREVIHSVLRVIGTRYVGKRAKNKKVNAALHNFDALVSAGTPEDFFAEVAAQKTKEAKIKFLADKFDYFKKKGCRDILIELRLVSNCMALDLRIMRILGKVGARVPKSLDQHYEQIESEPIEHVAGPSGLTGGELDRILFQNSGDILVRLLCR